MLTVENILIVLTGGCVGYIIIRLIFYAISKSWHEAKKHVEKEETNELQKAGEKEERRPVKKT